MDRPAHETEPSDQPTGADASKSPADPLDGSRRTAAIEEAVDRLSRLGRLDAASEATLVETLQRTQPEDWPVVVEAFAAALPPAEPLKTEPAPSDPTPSPPLSTTNDQPPPAADVTPHSASRPVSLPPPVDVPAPPPAAPAPSAPEPPAAPEAALKIQNPGFASRVRGWGDIDRFPDARFETGQEVIVYFELDGLATDDTAAGHTTRIDTVLALLGPDGTRLHTWRFAPLEDTSRQRRRDYFARYLVRMPAAAPGRCRLEVSVTDTLAGSSVGATLPLDIVPAAESR